MTRRKINVSMATVTGIIPSLQDIIVGQSGISLGLVQVIAANLDGSQNILRLYNGDSPITPQLVIPSSGTLFIDLPGGGELDLAIGSGLTGNLQSAGTLGVEVAGYYVTYDERNPSSLLIAIVPSTVRTPNRSGGQTES